MLRRLILALVRRLGTLSGGFIGTFLVLSPAQSAQLEAAAVVIFGVVIDALLFDGRDG